MNDIGRLDTREAPQIITPEEDRLATGQMPAGEGQPENEAANRKEEVDPIMPDAHDVVHRVAFHGLAVVREVKGGNAPNVKGDHRHDGDEAQTIDLRNE